MTRHPDALEKINYVVQFAMDPCDAPMQIYVKSFEKAALKLLIAWFAIDMVQVFTGYVRPHGALRRPRGSGHRRSKPPRSKPKTWLSKANRWLSFDPYDALGRNLPGGDDLSARKVHHGVHTLWSVYDHMQKIAYWVMVFNLTVDFFYDWASGVKESKYCQAQQQGWLHARGPDDTMALPIYRRPVAMNIIEKMRGPIYWAGVSGHTTAREYTIIFSAGIKRVDWADGDPQGFVVEVLGAGGDHHSEPEPDENGNFTIAVTGHNGGSIVVYSLGTGIYTVTNPQITIIAND